MNHCFIQISLKILQVNLDMTDSMGPGKLVRHMQNPSYTYDEYLICIGLGPSISSVICKNPSYSGPSYPSSSVLCDEDIFIHVRPGVHSMFWIVKGVCVWTGGL